MNLSNLIFTTIVAFGIIFFPGDAVFSHSPHDVIFDVELSPVFADDKTLFIISSNTLMISTDEGYTWKKLINGLDYSSQLSSVAVSPAFNQDRTVWVTSENNGIYRSENGGKSWENANRGLDHSHILSVLPSPRFIEDPSAVALDVEGRLYGSTDSGRTWETIHDNFKGDITCVAFLPMGDYALLVAGTDQGEIMLSDESGRHWSKVTVLSDCLLVTSITVSPYYMQDGKIWVGTECGVYEVVVPRKYSRAVNQGLTDPRITSLMATPGDDNCVQLYASSWDEALFKADDREEVWVKQDKGLTTDPQAKDPHFMMPNFKGIAAREEILFLGGYDGLFKSINGGKKWEQVDTILLSGITGLDVYTERGSENQKVALATYGAGAYLYDSQTREWNIINNGLEWTRLNDIAFSPDYSNDGFLFSGSENNFLVFNRKESYWKRIPISKGFGRRVKGRITYYLKKIGLKKNWIHSIFPPVPTDSLFPSVIGLSPDFSTDRTLFFGTRSSGLYMSDNIGRSHSPVWDANESLITSICLSPRFGANGMMYVGVYNSGIYKSINKGKTWDKADSGIYSKKQIRMTMSPHFSNDGIIAAGNASGLYITQDGGKNWRSIGMNDFGPGPNIVCVAISPAFKEDNLIVVGINGKGLWMTQDMGESFSPFAESLIDNNYQAKFIRFSDNYHLDKTIYCASSYELFCSRDGGTTWHRLSRPIRYENLREEIRLSGDWQTVEDDRYSARSASYAKTSGSRFRLRFVGTEVSWIGDTSPSHGRANVYLNGKLVKTVSLFSEKKRVGIEILSIKGLEARSHELVVENLCALEKDECGFISIDAIDVIEHDESVQGHRVKL